MKILEPTSIFYFLIFPGFLFTAVAGLLASWLDRKITARLQRRVGPPLYQCFADFLKLLSKEAFIPEGSNGFLFILSPLISLAGVTLASATLWVSSMNPGKGFVGDVIVVVYLLMLPSLALILGGSASGNPHSAIGASREIKLFMAYELPFLLAIFTPVVKSGILSLGGIAKYQAEQGMFVASASGAIAFTVALFCVQAKLGITPFDIPDAETELMGGPYIEYSGAPLGILRLSKAMMLFVLPSFVLLIFWGSIWSSWFILKYFLFLLFIVVFRNTSPRLRIDQAIKLFWFPLMLLGVLGMILGVMGL